MIIFFCPESITSKYIEHKSDRITSRTNQILILLGDFDKALTEISK